MFFDVFYDTRHRKKKQEFKSIDIELTGEHKIVCTCSAGGRDGLKLHHGDLWFQQRHCVFNIHIQVVVGTQIK